MKFKRTAQLEYGLGQMDIVPFVNVVFLLFIFFMLVSPFALQAGINVQVPRAVTSDVMQEEKTIITISAENVLYLNNTVVTDQELRRALGQSLSAPRPVFIKAARRSSVGRIVEIWDLCRELGIEQIHIATNQDQ